MLKGSTHASFYIERYILQNNRKTATTPTCSSTETNNISLESALWSWATNHLVKSNLSLYSLYYAEACNEFAGPISTLVRLSNTAPFEEMWQRWRAIGSTMSDLTGSRFEPLTFCSRDERVYRSTNWLVKHLVSAKKVNMFYLLLDGGG